MAQLWRKKDQAAPNETILRFSVGNDPVLDQELAPFDLIASRAHANMLHQQGYLTREELDQLAAGIKALLHQSMIGPLPFAPTDEDCHTFIERDLTERYGTVGEKIHTGRSRNDQVLVALKLYGRHKLALLVEKLDRLAKHLITKADQNKHILIPGFTHTQVAMPSSAGLWFSAYAEALGEDLDGVYMVWQQANRNPLGSGAGYGGSLRLDRNATTKLLAFTEPHINVVNAQMARGKFEVLYLQTLGNIAHTLSKLADDICFYNSQPLRIVTLDEGFTTGSSIMPHKRNPDVFELLRAQCNRIKGLQLQASYLVTNQTSGYHRDLQQLKGLLMEGINQLDEVLNIALLALDAIHFNPDVIQEPRFADLFTVEAVNELVNNGIPFRQAYKEVGSNFDLASAGIHQEHTLLGSIHNLGLTELLVWINQKVSQFELPRYYSWYKAELVS